MTDPAIIALRCIAIRPSTDTNSAPPSRSSRVTADEGYRDIAAA
jgi:hypothetical protein